MDEEDDEDGLVSVTDSAPSLDVVADMCIWGSYCPSADISV
jgi:hypothetical protein